MSRMLVQFDHCHKQSSADKRSARMPVCTDEWIVARDRKSVV